MLFYLLTFKIKVPVLHPDDVAEDVVEPRFQPENSLFWGAPVGHIAWTRRGLGTWSVEARGAIGVKVTARDGFSKRADL